MSKALYIVFISAFVALTFSKCIEDEEIKCLGDYEMCNIENESSNSTDSGLQLNCTCIKTFGECLQKRGCNLTGDVPEESKWGMYMIECIKGNCSDCLADDPFPPCADFRSSMCRDDFYVCMSGSGSDGNGADFECNCIKAYGKCLENKKCDKYSKEKDKDLSKEDLWYDYIKLCYLDNQCTGCLGDDPATHCYKRTDAACKDDYDSCMANVEDNPMDVSKDKKKKDHNYTEFCACNKALGDCIYKGFCNDTKNPNWELYLAGCNGKAECGNCLAEDPNAGASLSSTAVVLSAALFAAFF